jgi:hypothetical protein
MKYRFSFYFSMFCVLLIFLSSCSLGGNQQALPELLPFLHKRSNSELDLSWYKGDLNLTNGIITDSDQPILVQNQPFSDIKLYWNGKTTFFSYSYDLDNRLLPVDEKEVSVFHQAVDSSPYFVFNASKQGQQVLTYLPAQASRREEVMVEIFGDKAQKLTLRMPSDEYTHLRILRPLAVASNGEEWEFYFQTIENSADHSKLGIIKATYDYSTISWKVLVKQMPFDETASGIQISYHHGTLYLSNQKGEIWTLHPKTGKMRKHEQLSKELEAFRTQLKLSLEGLPGPSFYTNEKFLIVQWNLTDQESLHLIVLKNKLHKKIETIKGELVLYEKNAQKISIELKTSMPLPADWIFPGP